MNQSQSIHEHQVHVPKTILFNIAHLGILLFTLIYLNLCFNAINAIEFEEPILRIPFIILIAFSALKLIGGWNPNITVIKKSNKVAQ